MRAAILSSLARRAYRRPVTAADVEPLMAFYREGAAQAGFDEGIERALRRLLVSPEFLFRVERDPAKVAAGASLPHQRHRAGVAAVVLPLEQHSRRRAARLSPSAGSCRTPSRARARKCAACWPTRAPTRSSPTSPGSGCSSAISTPSVPVQSVFPDFDDALRQAFRRETELFFESIVREDRSALDLLRADYTFLNERLARHYGVPNVKGSHFRRVTLEQGQPAQRAARAGQHPDRDVVSRSHVAGRARQVDSREPARHAAAAAAAERAAAASRPTTRARCCRCGSAWSSIAPTRCAPAATR